MPADRALIEAVRAGLHAAADPARAPRMQSYMKSTMPYYGVATPSLRRVTKEAFRAHPLGSFARWRDTALTLWREATYQEERYAATELTGQRSYSAYLTVDALPMFEEFVVTGAWWDHVDVVAIHRIGPILDKEPGPVGTLMRAWSTDADRWRRRSSIICQVARKERTDVELLHACIAANVADSDFFIRKAIGWALRAYAWVDPDEVARYVASLGERLSPLSRREALKNVGRSRPVDD